MLGGFKHFRVYYTLCLIALLDYGFWMQTAMLSSDTILISCFYKLLELMRMIYTTKP